MAALRLKSSWTRRDVTVDAEHSSLRLSALRRGRRPRRRGLWLKMLFGDAAHCFFAEPTHSPCMMLGMATGENNSICVQDFGIDNRTAADGLAVGRASGFVGG